MQAFLDGASVSSPGPELSTEVERQFPHLAVLQADERIVAIHASLGFSNQEIARALRRTEATVKRQLHSALQTLGVRNRTGLIAHNCRLR